MNNKYWKRFEQTGAIEDYLNYTACTSESANQNIAGRKIKIVAGEGGVRGCSKYNRHGVVSDANRRL